MKKNIQISVPEPCHEKWSSFTRTSEGGFCSSCQKEVIDFTSWSEDRLKLYFKHLSGNTCGRFRKGQLKVYTYEKSQTTTLGWLRVFLVSVVVLFTSRQASAQTPNSRHPTEQYQPEVKVGKTQITPSSIIKVSGVVRSPEEGLTLPGTNVEFKGTSHKTYTDADGRFTLSLENPDSIPVLVFSFIGFKTLEYPVIQSEQEILINLMHDETQLAEEVIVGGCVSARWYSPRRWWWGIKRLF